MDFLLSSLIDFCLKFCRTFIHLSSSHKHFTSIIRISKQLSPFSDFTVKMPTVSNVLIIMYIFMFIYSFIDYFFASDIALQIRIYF